MGHQIHKAADFIPPQNVVSFGTTIRCKCLGACAPRQHSTHTLSLLFIGILQIPHTPYPIPHTPYTIHHTIPHTPYPMHHMPYPIILHALASGFCSIQVPVRTHKPPSSCPELALPARGCVLPCLSCSVGLMYHLEGAVMECGALRGFRLKSWACML